MDDYGMYDQGCQHKERFTVNCQAKIDVIEKTKKGEVKTSVCLSFFKWIFTIFMFLLTLFCLVTSKLTLISLAQRLKIANFTLSLKGGVLQKAGKETHVSEIAFAMVTVIMIVPHLISFVRAAVNSAKAKEIWPAKCSIAWGVLSAFLETIGIGMYALTVIRTMENFSWSILMMNGIFLFPLLNQIFTEWRKVSRSRAYHSDKEYMPCSSSGSLGQRAKKHPLWILVLNVVAAACTFGGFVFMIYYLVTSTEQRIIILVSIIFLSIAWSPKLFKLQIKPSPEDAMHHEAAGQRTRIKTARNRMMLISSMIKLPLSILVSFGLSHFFNITSNRNPVISFARGFRYFTDDSQMVAMFFLQVGSSILGYLLCWLACTINLQKICFVSPLFLSTPVAFAISLSGKCEDILYYQCYNHPGIPLWHTCVLAAIIWLCPALSLNLQFFSSQQFLMAREKCLFWVPSYDSVLLEQHLLLNRKNKVTDEEYIDYQEVVKESRIYICTTMYHEVDYEMKQLLQSLAEVDKARKECHRQFEAHIFLDDGARGDVVKMFALQLISLLKEAMNIEPGKAFKLETPYGLQFKWILPHGMPFIIHLKDKVKVKNKKRWSQVMYMSYILDFKAKEYNDDQVYILATDADVKFTPNDVMALMDLMSRNSQVAAVCGRTHPLGSGPVVWYQIFDYAIGHWLLKVANHVYGSVLCSPGCFSVYRATAIRDVLPIYATNADCAMDFLMKDMGEDRWFCTLLVEAGWKLEYCATSEDSTYCPDNFDEFFKQRRRWGPSTLANSLAVLQQQKSIRENNHYINIFFIAYQMVLIISTVIGPSTVLLVVAGGLQYAFPASINLVAVLTLLIVVTILFTIVCLFCSQSTQLKTAKLLTFLFAIVMAITIVGIIHQIVDDVNSYANPPTKVPPTTNRLPPSANYPHAIQQMFAMHNRSAHVDDKFFMPNLDSFGKVPVTTAGPVYLRPKYIFSPATWYLFIISGVFILTAFMHGSEFVSLIHGIWYLLCLPSGYLLLTIYSVANLTDRSWGTREGKTQEVHSDNPLLDRIIGYLKVVCWCCIPPQFRQKNEHSGRNADEEAMDTEKPEPSNNSACEEDGDSSGNDETDGNQITDATLIDIGDNTLVVNKPESPVPKKSALKKRGPSPFLSPDELDKQRAFRFPGERKVKFSRNRSRLYTATPVEEWLPTEYKCYADNFKDNGYDTISFIAGVMKEKDLESIGISNRGHRKRLMIYIESLAPEELFQEVPENVEDWLMKLGLEEYWGKFSENSYTEARDLADIKYMNQEMISSIFDIKKPGHLRRLMMATSVLQYPTKAQKLIREARKEVMAEPLRKMETDNGDEGEEHRFWEELREICLLPEQAAFNQSGELVEKLGEMRDTCLMVLAVANVLWLSFMVTIMMQGTALNLMGTSFASVAFLFVYGVVLIMQFLSLLWHRLETLIHFIARAPFKPGHLRSNWAWRDKDLPAPPAPEILEEIRRRNRTFSNISSNHLDDGMLQTSSLTEPLLASSRSELNSSV